MTKRSSVAKSELTPLARALVEAAGLPMVKTEKPRRTMAFSLLDPHNTSREALARAENGQPSLSKSILNILNGPDDSVERLAFEADPSTNNTYASVFRQKLRLLPDSVLKRIAIQDDLVAAIINARCNHMQAFGRPRHDRHKMGFVIEPTPGIRDSLSPDEKKELQKRISKATKLLSTCGSTRGWKDKDRLTFSQYLWQSTRSALVNGRLATEVIWVDRDGKRTFHSFRAIDAGTIFQAANQKEAAEQVREEARHLLEQIKNKKLEPERFTNDEYAWIQVIEGRPLQAFTSEECLVYNFYPVPDVELDGYPLTPLDTVISAVTTHINITTHNKLYFQTGRASRGMLVISSDDVDDQVVSRIRQQFQASINSVQNAWRMPVFGVGKADDIAWVPIDNGGRDMEFQYLSDTNARVILSAFQMSPEELPGYAHLSRGTNNQALSESNNEYKLQAARDVGIRPLIKNFEDFINGCLFPLIDPELAEKCVVRLEGLDAETAEKESIRWAQDLPLHGTMDEMLQAVEKQPLGKRWGGEFQINPQWQAILDKYVMVGDILEHCFGIEGASKDPRFQYLRDPFFFQQVQLQMQQQQMQMQAQQQQMEAQAQQQQAAQGQPGQETDLTRSIDQVVGLLSKSEQHLPPSKRRTLAQHRKLVEHHLKGWEADSKAMLGEILKVADKHQPRS